jgi:hypothetical protein
LPESLDETYERILREIKKPNQRHAHRLFECLVAAVRPLALHELAEVLTFDFDTVDAEGIPELNPQADWRHSWEWEDHEEAIMSACSNLVVIVKDRLGRRIVQFSHFSVKEFLTANRLAEPIRDVSRYHIRLDAAHTTLVRACLGGLLRPLQLYSDLIDVIPLIHYAAKNWFTHAQFEDVSSRVKNAIRCLFDADKPHFAVWVSLYQHRYSEVVFPLFYVTCFGFRDAAEHIIAQHPEQINAKGRNDLTALHAAVAEGQNDILSLLLKHGANAGAQDASDMTPLHRAVLEGNLEAGRRLLDHGAAINPRARHNLTPVCVAVMKGHVEFARMLLERGAAMDVRPMMGPDWRTPLAKAVSLRNIQMVRLLLEYGEDVNERDGLGRTPSEWASISEQQDILELLSEYGAESIETVD